MFKLLSTILLLSGVGSFISCTGNYINVQNISPRLTSLHRKESVYGNYLAGRVAHIRQDYQNASNYYIKSMEKGLINEDIIGKTYIMLASQGDIKKASKYANQARSRGDKNNFIDVINAVHEFKKGNYALSRSVLSTIKEKTYQNLITPLFDAWTYVGENKYEEAMAALEPLKTEEEMKTVYNLHAGIISDYFNHNKLAQAYYNTIVSDKSDDVSFRALQIISNSMVRNNRKEDAVELVSKYYGASNVKEMLSSLSKKIKQSDSSAKLLINTPDKGASEVFLEIGLLFKSVPVGYEYAQVYMAIAEYFNPNNDVAKIAMADIFETRNMYNDANRYYDSIKRESEMYYPAQIKKANNLTAEEKYEEATVVLKKLLKTNPKNFQVLFNLGDVLRMSDNQIDAIKYYNQAIDTIFYETEKYWPLYYALAVSYDKNNEWEKAEQSLYKALSLSNRHPQVLNYLGYTWLKQDANIDKAASYILEAYEKEPNDGVIMDSLGWVYFKTGDYKNAIIYLEKASELNPRNAVISDHLGDAYWLGGRKNEAVFLWKQALTQKEDAEAISRNAIKSKIKKGINNINAYSLKDEKIKETLNRANEITH